MIKRFIKEYDKEIDKTKLKYNAGYVYDKEGEFYTLNNAQNGALETFSVGQPVFDEDKNLMGYLGIALFNHLDYATNGIVRIPVEKWCIMLPTKHCQVGKDVYTYWQNKEE